MSEYGRLYEEVSRIRAQLKAFRRVRVADIYKVVEATRFKNSEEPQYGDVTAERLISTDRFADAKKSVERLKDELDAMIYEWGQLEKKMERSDG